MLRRVKYAYKADRRVEIEKQVLRTKPTKSTAKRERTQLIRQKPFNALMPK